MFWSLSHSLPKRVGNWRQVFSTFLRGFWLSALSVMLCLDSQHTAKRRLLGHFLHVKNPTVQNHDGNVINCQEYCSPCQLQFFYLLPAGMAFSGSPCPVSGPMGLVPDNLGMFLFLYVSFHWGIPSKSLLQSACFFFPSILYRGSEAYFSGCLWKPAVRVVLQIRTIWESSLVFNWFPDLSQWAYFRYVHLSKSTALMKLHSISPFSFK